MSLVKQLWIAIVVVMTVAFGGSLVVSVLSARSYLEQQLQVKNIDNATSLALSLTQLDKDPVTVELQVAAQFDAGHYRFIRVVSPTGETLVERVYEGELYGAPRWFANLIPIQADPGQAQIMDGWKQFGTITLASHEQYVYKSLWEGTLELLAWFVLGSVLTGVLGTLAIRVITRPLRDVVDQAQAIAERRFLTVPEPRTPELRAVAQAMNAMVERLKAMFAEESSRLESLRKKVNRDPVTGIANREYFMSQLREVLTGEMHGSVGSLVLVRLAYLNELNAKLGHQRADQLLRELADVLFHSGDEHPGQRAGRVKGGEFAVVCPTYASPTEAARDIYERLCRDWLPHWEPEFPDLFHLAAVGYERNQSIGDLMTRADEALAKARAKGPNTWHAEETPSTKLSMPAEQWRTLLTEAVAGGQLSLAFYPVVRREGGDQPLHQEGVIRLQVDTSGQLLSAGDFMPMAASLNLTAPIDLGVVRLAIEHLQQGTGDVAVNLSAETIGDFTFRNQLLQLLQGYPALCKRLLFEVPEYGVFRQFDAFRDLTRALKALGCRVGIEYFGQRFAESAQLASLGLDYIKVHPAYVRGISENPGNQEFLKGLCNMAHALGIAVIALGVESKDDLPLLAQLGFDGATGPGVR
ncbi:bifunctional diguanylate cyclase/phosphodiesterase [Tepidicella xavieri]|uniref:Diguanylate cyclase/phosphodiesterase n=1 Tax=Tepidicella xavieri TaxID=360241 RepID=A0A4R6U4B6_9BURK|nr:EAL domain-containing protein [Tepidicella xavieri]TDQ39285.1 diguanylate cyclase/phosphodiesterase [Tepidicella xavieri]